MSITKYSELMKRLKTLINDQIKTFLKTKHGKCGAVLIHLHYKIETELEELIHKKRVVRAIKVGED